MNVEPVYTPVKAIQRSVNLNTPSTAGSIKIHHPPLSGSQGVTYHSDNSH